MTELHLRRISHLTCQAAFLAQFLFVVQSLTRKGEDDIYMKVKFAVTDIQHSASLLFSVVICIEHAGYFYMHCQCTGS